MKGERPLYDPDERVFTLADIKKLGLRQKAKLIKACYLGAVIGLSFALITFAPKYRISATFKEAPSQGNSGMILEKFVGSFGSFSPESQTIAVIQSYQVLKPLVERMGLQAEVARGGLLSKMYRRIRDNLLAEGGGLLEEIDWFSFRNIEYLGESDISYSLQFHDPEHFSILSGKEVLASGSLGSPVHLSKAQLTIVKAPKNLRLKSRYPLVLRTWIKAAKDIRSHFRIETCKNQKSIFQLEYSHRDRHFGTEILNALMEEYRNYLQKDHDQLVQSQLVYLQKKQEEICDRMSATFDEYTEYLQDHLAQTGQLGLKQEIEEITKGHKILSGKLFAIDLELDWLNRISMESKTSLPVDMNPLSQAVKTTVEQITNLKQQRDFIELSLTSKDHTFNESRYENRKEELRGIRDQISSLKGLLEKSAEDPMGSQDALFHAESSIEAWAQRLSDSQEAERKDLADYIGNRVRLLSMQEKMVQDQISYACDIPSEFNGLDFTTARTLFAEYNKKLDQSIQAMGHFSRLAEEIGENDFEISSLNVVLNDPLSFRLIEQASKIALKLKDVTHRSEKESERWTEELLLQKKILKDHLDQLFKVEQLKSELFRKRIAALQTISLGSISGQISVLQERLADAVKERIDSLLTEKKILEENRKEILTGFADLPEKWRREEWIHLKTQMGIKMVGALTELIESKTISSHLHHVESKPLDFATLPTLPCRPGLLFKTFLGAFLFGFAVFSRSFLQTVLRGFPSSLEKLSAMRYPILGELSPFCDGKETEPIGGSDLEALRKISLFLDEPPQGKIVGLIEGKGPDYSYALAGHFARTSLRSLIIRCDFNPKFSVQDTPGLLQFLNQETELPIRNRQEGDYLPSGGYTPYGAEILRSDRFRLLLEQVKMKYDFIFLVFRAPIQSVESFSALSFCDRAIVTVSNESTEQLTPFVDWAYHDGMCRLSFLASGSS